MARDVYAFASWAGESSTEDLLGAAEPEATGSSELSQHLDVATTALERAPGNSPASSNAGRTFGLAAMLR
jgi:hypothetical protein